MKTKSYVVSLLCMLIHWSAFGQGALTPPAAPGPTMKTLQQIEPRYDLQNAPGGVVSTSDPNFQYVINGPGSFYLSSVLVPTKPSAIKIAYSDVTLDLNGFFVVAPAGNGTTGIDVSGGFPARVTIRNGAVWGFSYGVGNDANTPGVAVRDVTVGGCTFRPMILAGAGALVENCRIVNNYNAEAALIVGAGSTVRNCIIANNTLSLAGLYADVPNAFSAVDVTITGNTMSYGIATGGGSTLTRCLVAANTCTVAGIYANSGSALENCTAKSNTTPNGIRAFNSSLTNCVANANTSNASSSSGFNVDNCTVNNSTAFGNDSTAGSIAEQNGAGFVLINSRVHNCAANNNRGSGFRMTEGGSLVHCTALNNGQSGNAGAFGAAATHGTVIVDLTAEGNPNYGIYVGDGSSVLDSTVRLTGSGNGSGIGIRVGDNSTIARCTVSNGTNDGINFGNFCNILNNTVSNNGTNNTGNGIHSFGNSNRIDGNMVQNNKAVGILANPSDLVIRNTAQNNPAGNYVPASGPNLGPIGTPASATSPWANF